MCATKSPKANPATARRLRRPAARKSTNADQRISAGSASTRTNVTRDTPCRGPSMSKPVAWATYPTDLDQDLTGQQWDDRDQYHRGEPAAQQGQVGDRSRVDDLDNPFPFVPAAPVKRQEDHGGHEKPQQVDREIGGRIARRHEACVGVERNGVAQVAVVAVRRERDGEAEAEEDPRPHSAAQATAVRPTQQQQQRAEGTPSIDPSAPATDSRAGGTARQPASVIPV